MCNTRSFNLWAKSPDFWALNFSDLSSNDNEIVCNFSKVLKTTRPGFHSIFKICRFSLDNKVCPVLCLKTYLERTRELRSNSNDSLIFISFQKPHKQCILNPLVDGFPCASRRQDYPNITLLIVLEQLTLAKPPLRQTLKPSLKRPVGLI